MLSKNKARFIVSLQKKKVRDEEGLYVIEGDKIVREFLSAGENISLLVAKPEFIRSLSSELLEKVDETEEAAYEDLKHVSTLKTPHNALAIVRMHEKNMNIHDLSDGITCVLEFIQDPGNLGTIMRAAAWFGIKNIVCSPDSVDIYNPKVIQASMGALLHVDVFYSDLPDFLSRIKDQGVPVFGALLGGMPVYDHPLSDKGVILLGNESKGISESILPYITDKIMIPGEAKPGIDSLNVGMAASIMFSEFRRRRFNI